MIPDTPKEALTPPPALTPAPGIRDTLPVRVAKNLTNSKLYLSSAKYSRPKNIKKLLHKRTGNIPNRISFKEYASVDVSIIIPVFNKLDYTLACLESLMSNLPKDIKSEVVVVDNASTDKTSILSKVKGLTYVQNEKNEGFVGGCNIGAQHSKGEYLVFLNNDTVITPGWLEYLYKTISVDPGIGLVGSKILYMDGRLQEAGGIIYKDGSGCNYGKTDHPDRYQYNYVRDVDYCSGASIILRKKLFDDLGGFDELYAPAYYEDTDLAFKVRGRGLRVLYQPRSVIYHIEGGTAGTDTGSGFKKYQEINHKKFLNRWSDDLRKNHYTPDEQYLAKDGRKRKIALIVDEAVPSPEEDSGSVRMFRIITSLIELGYKVVFYPNYAVSSNPNIAALQQMGVEVVYGETELHEILFWNGKHFDLVILSRPRIASLFLDLCNAYCKKAKIIFDTVDLHFLRLKRQAEYESSATDKKNIEKKADAYERLEKQFMQEVDATLVVSEIEKKILEQDKIQNVRILSNIHILNDDAYKSGYDKRRDLLFVGGYKHAPNIDAVNWFVDTILPSVVKELPGIKLHVVGSHMPEALESKLKKTPNVILDGFVSDDELRKLFMQSRVFVAPLRFGAGVKGKIGQSIEFGTPIVSTEIGIEGMHLQDRYSCLVADEEKEFARKIIELYTDRNLWVSIQKNASLVIDQFFSMSVARKALKQLVK